MFIKYCNVITVALYYQTNLTCFTDVRRCDVSCILPSFKGHNYITILLRTSCHFSSARLAKNCKYLFPKRKSFAFPKKARSRKMQKIWPLYKIKEPQKSISRLPFNSLSRANSAVLFWFYKVNQLPWRNYLNFSEKSFLIKLLTLKLKFSLLKIISSINYRLW